MINTNKCKYITPDSIIVCHMIEILYDDLEECCGGLAHIVADDNNLDDGSLITVIDECNKEENQNRHDVHVCKILCEALLRLSLEERYFIFAYLESDIDYSITQLLNFCVCSCSDFCNGRCLFKNELNKFYANQKCIEETGNNLQFLDGNYPIEDI